MGRVRANFQKGHARRERRRNDWVEHPVWQAGVLRCFLQGSCCQCAARTTSKSATEECCAFSTDPKLTAARTAADITRAELRAYFLSCRFGNCISFRPQHPAVFQRSANKDFQVNMLLSLAPLPRARSAETMQTPRQVRPFLLEAAGPARSSEPLSSAGCAISTSAVAAAVLFTNPVADAALVTPTVSVTTRPSC